MTSPLEGILRELTNNIYDLDAVTNTWEQYDKGKDQAISTALNSIKGLIPKKKVIKYPEKLENFTSDTYDSQNKKEAFNSAIDELNKNLWGEGEKK